MNFKFREGEGRRWEERRERGGVERGGEEGRGEREEERDPERTKYLYEVGTAHRRLSSSHHLSTPDSRMQAAFFLLLLSSDAFTVDVGSPFAALSPKIIDSFGSSHGSTTLRATWRQHFGAIQRDIPFKRVRFHGILDDDLSTYLNGEANGALVFDTLDYLVSVGIKPTVELGFMPIELSWNSSLTNFHYQGGTGMYKSESAWRAFITGFVSIIVQRYTLAEVSTWRFEVWNVRLSLPFYPLPWTHSVLLTQLFLACLLVFLHTFLHRSPTVALGPPG